MYADHEPDWADACLAVLSGRDHDLKVWTYDREFRTTWRRPMEQRFRWSDYDAARREAHFSPLIRTTSEIRVVRVIAIRFPSGDRPKSLISLSVKRVSGVGVPPLERLCQDVAPIARIHGEDRLAVGGERAGKDLDLPAWMSKAGKAQTRVPVGRIEDDLASISRQPQPSKTDEHIRQPPRLAPGERQHPRLLRPRPVRDVDQPRAVGGECPRERHRILKDHPRCRSRRH